MSSRTEKLRLFVWLMIWWVASFVLCWFTPFWHSQLLSLQIMDVIFSPVGWIISSSMNLAVLTNAYIFFFQIHGLSFCFNGCFCLYDYIRDFDALAFIPQSKAGRLLYIGSYPAFNGFGWRGRRFLLEGDDSTCIADYKKCWSVMYFSKEGKCRGRIVRGPSTAPKQVRLAQDDPILRSR